MQMPFLKQSVNLLMLNYLTYLNCKFETDAAQHKRAQFLAMQFTHSVRWHFSWPIQTGQLHWLIASEGLANLAVDITGHELRSTSTTCQDVTSSLWAPIIMILHWPIASHRKAKTHFQHREVLWVKLSWQTLLIVEMLHYCGVFSNIHKDKCYVEANTECLR